MTNILVYPCGSEIGLEIYRSLESVKDITIFGANTVNDHGRFIFKNYFELSSIDELSFDELNQAIEDFEIDFIFPAHDSVVLKFAENQDKINAIILTPSGATCHICRSKQLTYDYFRGKLPVPEYADSYPIFLKPDIGQGTKGCYKVSNIEELEFYIKHDDTLMDLEYLPGKEYTVDCFTDRHGKLLYAKGRERVRINNGISVNSKQVNDTVFKKYARIINNNLELRGVWFFQLKERESGEKVLLEVAPRVAGTMSLSRIKGANLPLLTLYDRMSIDVEIINNDLDIEVDRALTAKYSEVDYHNVYIDLDDTIIQGGKVNPRVMQFLYQAYNERKKIYLITKNNNIHNTLFRFSICEELFDDIIQVETEKNIYITSDSIFIDDSFSERKKVSDKCHVPVFDVNAIEALIK
jgi:hypothetical protein